MIKSYFRLSLLVVIMLLGLSLDSKLSLHIGQSAIAFEFEEELAFPQKYTGASTEFVFDILTGCTEIIQVQYEVTKCITFLWHCTEGMEEIMTHSNTVCENQQP